MTFPQSQFDTVGELWVSQPAELIHPPLLQSQPNKFLLGCMHVPSARLRLRALENPVASFSWAAWCREIRMRKYPEHSDGVENTLLCEPRVWQGWTLVGLKQEDRRETCNRPRPVSPAPISESPRLEKAVVISEPCFAHTCESDPEKEPFER